VGTPTWSCGTGRQWSDLLYPVGQADLIGLDALFGQQLFDVSIRECIVQVPRIATMITSGENLNSAKLDRRSGRREQRRRISPACLRLPSANATAPYELGWISIDGTGSQRS
jgi:hypothetical protein